MFSIDPALKTCAPSLKLDFLIASVQVTKHDPLLWKEINQEIEKIKSSFTLENISQDTEIKALREAYRAMGKDPARYRGSQEALMRRILQGKGLYQINSIVDLNNLVSIKTHLSLGCYDFSCLKPPCVFRIGKPGETYQGIGKDILNIEGLPVLCDTTGPFGSPTSDSERSKITLQTQKILMVLFSFAGSSHLSEYVALTEKLLQTHASATIEKTYSG